MKPIPPVLSSRWVILLLACIGLGVLTYPNFSWSLRPEHFFFADDWGWLHRAQFTGLFGDMYPWPKYVYNDRPVGAVLIQIVYRLFGLDNVAFHAVWVGIHILNTLLVFALGVRLFGSTGLAFVTAYAFGNWTASTMAPTWVAAVFDLVCNTFVLASVVTFLSKRPFLRNLSPPLYFVAVRTKETALLLPVLLLVYVLLTVPREQWQSECLRRVKWHFVLLGLFIGAYGYLLATSYVGRIPAGDPYFFSPSLRTFAEGSAWYVSAMLYRTSPLPIPVLLVVAALLIVLLVTRRGKPVILGAAGFLLFLLPVLFLSNQRSELYLYIPSVFAALSAVGFAQEIFACLPWPRVRGMIGAAVALVCFLALPHGAVARNRSAFVLTKTSFCKENLDQVRSRFPTLRAGTKFIFVGLPAYFNVFDYGPCYSLKLAYRDPSISCRLLDANEALPEQGVGENSPIVGVFRSGRLEFVGDLTSGQDSVHRP